MSLLREWTTDKTGIARQSEILTTQLIDQFKRRTDDWVDNR